MHLLKDNEYGEAWCGAHGDMESSLVVAESDCISCLEAAELFGKEASDRLRRLRPALPRKGRAGSR